MNKCERDEFLAKEMSAVGELGMRNVPKSK